jgi:hypothetical protein
MTITVKDFSGNPVTVPTPPDNGRAVAAASRPVALSNEDFAALSALSGFVDGIEGLIGATNAAIATLNTYVDGLEALAGATNTALAVLHADLTAATPAGAALIGKVSIDQATAGANTVTIPALALSATSVSTNVAALAASTALLVANPLRKGGAIVNDSTSILYIKLSAGASATSYDYFLAGSSSGVPAQFEIPQGYTGPINGFWVSAVGNARMSERTA